MFIGIAGLIGAGKSTLTQNLADHLGYKTAFEPVAENPYLEDFYEDIPRWTFNMQMFLLAERFKQHQEVVWDPVHSQGGGVVQDRTIYEDTIFATMHRDDGILDDRDWATYTNHFNLMKRYLVYPDVILYLRVDPEVAANRIQQRGRHMERGIPLDYLAKLHAGYEEFVAEMGRYTKVVVLDWNEYRPTEQVVAQVRAVAQDQKFLRSLRRI